MKLITNWLDSFNYSKEELNKLTSIRETDEIVSDNFEDEKARTFAMLPFNSFTHHNLTVDTCATNIIDMLFAKYVDDDTLVITTGSEHHSVKNNLKKCKNVVHFVCRGEIRKDIDIIKAIKPFKKIFIYMIGLSVGDPHYLNNCIIERLQNLLANENKQFVTVLDAVQELFLLPRDYSIYDYVVGTSHALIPNYDMGMLFGKNELSYKAGNWLKDFNDCMSILLRNRDKLYQLNVVLRQHFAKFTCFNSDLIDSSRAPYVYNLCDYKKRLDGLNDVDYERGAVAPGDYTPVTFRACPFLAHQEKFINRIQLIDDILEADMNN